MQRISLIWGLFTLFGMLIGFVPFGGALNWLLIPFAVIGTIVSAIALGVAPDDASIGKRTAGLISCGIAAIFGFLRLVAGGASCELFTSCRDSVPRAEMSINPVPCCAEGKPVPPHHRSSRYRE